MENAIPIPINDDITLFVSTDLTSWLNPIFLIVDVLEWLGVIPDPLDLLMSLFTGRPRDAATSQVVQYLGTRKNAAARLYGVALGRLLADQNIVLSSSSAADQKLLSQAYQQFVGSLQAQGMTLAAARQAADTAVSPAAQAGTAKIPILETQAPSTFSIVGPASMAVLYQDGITTGTAKGYTGTQLSNWAFRYTLSHAHLDDLLATQIAPAPPVSYPMATPPPNWPQNDATATTTNPAPSTTVCKPGYTLGPDGLTCWLDDQLPGANQTCPVNYTYDDNTGLCLYTPPSTSTTQPSTGLTPIVPGQPASPTLPAPPAPQPGGDELTDCCNATATYLYYIASSILSLASQGGTTQGSQGQCCQNIVNALTTIGTAIQAIPAAIPAPAASSPVDLTGVVAILTSIQTTLAQLDQDGNTNAAALTAAVANIGNAIANAPPTDVSGIVSELAQLVTQGDVPQSVIDYLASSGYISGSDAQVISGAPWAEVIVTVFRTWGWNALLWVASWVGITWNGSTWALSGLGEGIANLISQAISSALTAGAAPLLPEIQGLVDGVASVLQPAGAVSLGNIGVNPDAVLAKTLAPALILNGVALVGSYLGWEISESLEKYVDWASALVGLEELKDVLIGSLFRNGIVKVTDMQTRALFRQEMPSTERMYQWAAAGWFSADRAAALAPYNGTPAELIPAIQNASYTNMPARLLQRLFDSPTFSQSDLQRILVEHGMRPQDITDYMNALPYLSTQPQRTQLVATYEKAYIAGLLSDGDLINAIDNAQQNTDYLSLIDTRCQTELLIETSKALESSYTNLLHAGSFDIPTYQSALEGIGLQPNKVNNLIAVGENWQTATAQRQATAAEKRLQTATTAEERKAALKNYAAGNINAAGLAAALLLTGLTPVQAAAWVDVATLQQGGSLRLVYGQLLLPAQATLLRGQVSAIVDQRKKNLITDDVMLAQLTQLNIPSNWQNALLAAADANIDVTGSPVLVKVLT